MKKITSKLFHYIVLVIVAMSLISCARVERGRIGLSTNNVEIPQSGGTAIIDSDTMVRSIDLRISHDNEEWGLLEDLQSTYQDHQIISIKNDMINVEIIKSDLGECGISITLPENVSHIPNYYRVSVSDHVINGNINVYQPGI